MPGGQVGARGPSARRVQGDLAERDGSLQSLAAGNLRGVPCHICTPLSRRAHPRTPPPHDKQPPLRSRGSQLGFVRQTAVGGSLDHAPHSSPVAPHLPPGRGRPLSTPPPRHLPARPAGNGCVLLAPAAQSAVSAKCTLLRLTRADVMIDAFTLLPRPRVRRSMRTPPGPWRGRQALPTSPPPRRLTRGAPDRAARRTPRRRVANTAMIGRPRAPIERLQRASPHGRTSGNVSLENTMSRHVLPHAPSPTTTNFLRSDILMRCQGTPLARCASKSSLQIKYPVCKKIKTWIRKRSYTFEITVTPPRAIRRKGRPHHLPH